MKRFFKFGVLFVLIFCFSCDKDNTPGPVANNTLTLLKSENKVLRDQEITFQLMDEQTDITSSAIFYVNDSAIEGNVFSSSAKGAFQVYANYNDAGTTVSTQVDSFEVYIPRKKVLVEGFTGTWCGNCPPLDYSVDKAQDSIEDLVVVMIHGGRGNGSGTDPFTTPEGMILFDSLRIPNGPYPPIGIPGFPTGVVDRTFFWEYSVVPPLLPFPLDELAPYEGFDTDISIKIESQLNGNNLSVGVNVISENEISNSKLVVFLLEDGLLYDQVNYRNDDEWSPFYQMGNPIVDFEHNHVLRMSLTDPLGDEIPETSALTEYNKNFNVEIPSEYDTSNLKLVVTLIGEDNLVRNTQGAPINQFQDYE
jgi:hypothetical protein